MQLICINQAIFITFTERPVSFETIFSNSLNFPLSIKVLLQIFKNYLKKATYLFVWIHVAQEYKISPYILCRWKDKQWLSMSASASNTRPVCNRLFVINLHQFRHLFWFIYLHEMYISKQVVECITLKLIEVEACIAIQSFLEFSIESYFKYFCFTARENIL